MVLMVLLHTQDKKNAKKVSFIVGETTCKKDTSKVLIQTFLQEEKMVADKLFTLGRSSAGALKVEF